MEALFQGESISTIIQWPSDFEMVADSPSSVFLTSIPWNSCSSHQVQAKDWSFGSNGHQGYSLVNFASSLPLIYKTKRFWKCFCLTLTNDAVWNCYRLYSRFILVPARGNLSVEERRAKIDSYSAACSTHIWAPLLLWLKWSQRSQILENEIKREKDERKSRDWRAQGLEKAIGSLESLASDCPPRPESKNRILLLALAVGSFPRSISNDCSTTTFNINCHHSNTRDYFDRYFE